MHPPLLRLFVLALLAAPAWPALALYKVEQPDGSVTYTDRPPSDGSGRVITLGSSAATVPQDVAMPVVLRQTAQRYPVVLYTSPECEPCDSGRLLLQQRGVPYSERVVTSEEDAAALERAVGGRTVPALTIGAQPLRGLSESDWSAYLDAAGYPRESSLPRGWQPPAPQPLAQRAPQPQLQPRPATSPTPVVTPPPAAEPTAAGTLRF